MHGFTVEAQIIRLYAWIYSRSTDLLLQLYVNNRM